MPRKKIDKSNPSDAYCKFCDKPHDNALKSTCEHCGTATPGTLWRAYHGSQPVDANDEYRPFTQKEIEEAAYA